MTSSLRKDFIDFINLLKFPSDDIETLTKSFDTIMTHPKAIELLYPHIERYKNGEWFDYFTYIGAIEQAGEHIHTNKRTDFLMGHLCAAAYSYPAFEKNGFSKEIWLRSMKDFTFKNEECKTRYGVCGTFVNWYARWYAGNRAAMGRLQFESYTSYFNMETPEITIKQGDDIVNIHIPSEKDVPLTDEEVDNSIKQAAEYYSKLFGKDKIVFHCHSWMLHPCHMDKLPESSNIVHFAKRFNVFSTNESDEDIWRIFPIEDYDGDPSKLPAKTMLQKVYKKLLEDKVPIGEAAGYFVYNCK